MPRVRRLVLYASGQSIALPISPADARRDLREALQQSQWQGDIEGALLALHEALINAHEHGGGATQAKASIRGDDLVVEVWDRGVGFDAARFRNHVPDPTAERGRGLWLISCVATDWETRCYDSGGSSLLLRFNGRRAA